jgi:hypothetical protein
MNIVQIAYIRDFLMNLFTCKQSLYPSRIADQAETKALITFFSLQTKQVSQTTLTNDLKTGTNLQRR